VPVGAALYGTILAAYKTLAASYQPGYVNAVIVLTAGVENAPGDISGALTPAGTPIADYSLLCPLVLGSVVEHISGRSGAMI
jgi:hypothetical protein